MKRKVYTDGNGSSLIDVEGLGQYLPARDFKQQQQEIAELKSLLQLCVNDMYKPSGKISKATGRKLMTACQNKLVEFPQ
jgi:hypothetical protein